jgi:hypothetical protein
MLNMKIPRLRYGQDHSALFAGTCGEYQLAVIGGVGAAGDGIVAQIRDASGELVGSTLEPNEPMVPSCALVDAIEWAKAWGADRILRLHK